ncbi:unnamed protein product, partial [Mesorhabditis belari]|uniref:Uncharacterized protein n=1 Tax=Mesorhabditis belari TaxID=2138241 RepID=A0AAF3FMP2_9BILA
MAIVYCLLRRLYETSLLLIIVQLVFTEAFPQRIAIVTIQKENSQEVQLMERIEQEMERRQMYEELRNLHASQSSSNLPSHQPHHFRKSKRNKRVMEEFDPRKQQEESAKRFGRIGGSIIMGKRR